MRKSIIFIALSVIFFIFSAKILPVYATCTCTNIVCHWVDCTQGEYPGQSGWCKICSCGGYYCGTCGPGDYVCGSGCCDIVVPSGGTGGEPEAGCSITAPTNLTVVSYPAGSATSSRVTWSPPTGANSQVIFIGANKTEVDAGCPGISSPACIVDTPVTGSSYDTGNILTVGTVYYYKVFAMNTTIANCSAGSSTVASLLSCETSLSSNPIVQGSSATLTTSVNASSGIANVRYTLGSADYASFAPSAPLASITDSAFPYSSIVYGRSPGGPTLVTSDVRDAGGAVLCSDTDNVTVTYPAAWWQVKDSDLQAQGDLSSTVPSTKFFGMNGAGGYPGVAAYSTSTNLTNTNVSENNDAKWLANSLWASPKVFNYAYFAGQIPEGTITNTIDHIDSTVLGSGAIDSATGYYWYKYNGNDHSGQALTVTALTDIGSRKVIVLVENANVDISQSITLNDGFFMLVVEGNINISPAVGGGASPNLEGLYIADGTLQTGTLTPGGTDTQLWVRGSVVANNGITLSRDLKDSNFTTPGELFEYAPDQIMLFPEVFATRKINWKEVAP